VGRWRISLQICAQGCGPVPDVPVNLQLTAFASGSKKAGWRVWSLLLQVDDDW